MNKKTMIAVIATIIVAVCLLFISTVFAYAWNNSIFDTTWHFDRAVISLPNSSFCVEGKVELWKDFENSDVVQVKIDGITYVTHYSNVVLISE